jgi:hypothetical protein
MCDPLVESYLTLDNKTAQPLYRFLGIVSHIPKFGDASKSPAGDVVGSSNYVIRDTADFF